MEVTTLEFISVRDFKAQATRIIREGRDVLIMRGGKPAGFFVPWDELKADSSFRRAALEVLMARLEQERTEKGVTEEEVMADFESFRKDRRRR